MVTVGGMRAPNALPAECRNVENQPVTGATYFRHCLEDLNERLVTTGEDLHALEAVSVDAISLKVGGLCGWVSRRAVGTLASTPPGAFTSPLCAGARGALRRAVPAEPPAD